MMSMNTSVVSEINETHILDAFEDLRCLIEENDKANRQYESMLLHNNAYKNYVVSSFCDLVGTYRSLLDMLTLPEEGSVRVAVTPAQVRFLASNPEALHHFSLNARFAGFSAPQRAKEFTRIARAVDRLSAVETDLRCKIDDFIAEHPVTNDQ